MRKEQKSICHILQAQKRHSKIIEAQKMQSQIGVTYLFLVGYSDLDSH